MIFLCHKFTDWHNLYKDFINLRITSPLASGSKSCNPSRISMQLGLSKSDSIKALAASNRWLIRPNLAVKDTKIQRLSNWKTGANVSSKSLFDCSFPWVTNLTLNLSIVPGEILSVIGVAEGWLVGWRCYKIMYLVKSRNSRMKNNQLSTTDSGAQYIQMVLVTFYT